MIRSVDQIRATLAAWLASEGVACGVGDGPYELSYVPNPGGFVNANFTVASTSARWHCKLVHREAVAGHRRSWELRELLADRYAAPRMLVWIELEGALCGTVSEHVPGRRADRAADAALWPVVHALACDLHADAELAHVLGTPGGAGTCREYLESTWLGMLEADIAETRPHESAPPFVDRTFWEWAVEEVDRIRRLAARAAAFDEPADAPVHGDLHDANVLVGPDSWWIIDWDDLELGDPAKDLADWWYGMEGAMPSFPPFLAARLPLWRRTRLLVDVVDPLADWAEARVAPPDVRERMRGASREVHDAALRRYLDTY